MRPRGVIAAVAAVYLLAGSGCFLRDRLAGQATPPPDQVVPASRLPAPADRRIQLHTRLIEQPHGHDYLTRGVWADAVDPLPHELSARLAANGLRVGVISGSMPDELENLGQTAAISPMLRTVQVDQPKTVPVNGPLESVTVLLRGASIDAPRREYERAECAIVVTSTPTPDGRVRVRFAPHLQHGSRRPYFQPTADGFDREDRRPTEEFTALAWEVTLSASDVLVVGPTAEADDDALGAAFFLVRTPDRWRQRVFTLQATTSTAPRPAARGVTAALVR